MKKQRHANLQRPLQRFAKSFTKKHAHWTTEQWTKVMFSDESNFQVLKMGSTSGVR